MTRSTLPALAITLMRSSLVDRAKLARHILDRELRPLLPPVLPVDKHLELDTARMDDDAIVTLSIMRPRKAWNAATAPILGAMRACVRVCEQPDDPRAVDHLVVALAACEVAATRAKGPKAAGEKRSLSLTWAKVKATWDAHYAVSRSSKSADLKTSLAFKCKPRTIQELRLDAGRTTRRTRRP